jgi:hypothetical protein
MAVASFRIELDQDWGGQKLFESSASQMFLRNAEDDGFWWRTTKPLSRMRRG